MIPKIIHSCWFSNDPLPEEIKKCILTWKEVLPDYEIKIWNIDIINEKEIQHCPYVMEAIKEKKWAFASDYIRLYVLYKYGGIYLDSDIEMLKPFSTILQNPAFTGFEDDNHISAWIIGSEKNNPIIKEFLDDYEGRHFILNNGKYDMTPNPVPITNRLLKHGLVIPGEMGKIQKLDSITVYPVDYFCPFNPRRQGNDLFTNNTVCNHHFNGAWRPINERVSLDLELKLKKYIGYKAAHVILFPIYIFNKIKAVGLIGTIKYSVKKIMESR